MSDPIDIVARQILAKAARELEWENMPDIGEYDWLRVEDRCAELAPEPDGFNKAIRLLEDRADKEESWKRSTD